MPSSQKVALPIFGRACNRQRKGRSEPSCRDRKGKANNFIFHSSHRLTIILFVSMQYRQFAHELDAGRFPEGMQAVLDEVGAMKQE